MEARKVKKKHGVRGGLQRVTVGHNLLHGKMWENGEGRGGDFS